MRRLGPILACALAVASFTSACNAQESAGGQQAIRDDGLGSAASATAVQAGRVDDLFVLTGTRGRIERHGSTLTITLQSPGRSVLRFADRPVREAQRLTSRQLVDRWDALGFGQDPPNAVLAEAGAPGDGALAVVLTQPQWTKGETVQFTARVLRGGDSPLSRPREIGAASLFIDPSGSTVSDAGEPGCGTTGEIVFFGGAFVPEPMAVGNAIYRRTDFPDLSRLVGSRFGGTGSAEDFITPAVKPVDGNVRRSGAQPLLTLVCAKGAEPTPAVEDPTAVPDGPGGCTVGEVRYTGLDAEHAGWMRADGRTLRAEDFPVLADAIGTADGGQDGNTIQLPKVDVPALGPTLAPDAQICVHGVSQAEEQPTCTLGAMRLFAGPKQDDSSIAPKGQVMPIRGNEALFSLFGIRWGGDGSTTFSLPNLSPAPSGLRWSLCYPGTYPAHGDLDPSPTPGVVNSLEPLPPCAGTAPGATMSLQMRFVGADPFNQTLTVPLTVERVVDRCTDPLRTLDLEGSDNSIVVSRATDREGFTGVITMGGTQIGTLEFSQRDDATGVIVAFKLPGFCSFVGLDTEDCRYERESDDAPPIAKFNGTFTLTPGVDSLGLRDLFDGSR